VACRAGLLVRARPSSRARTWAVAVGLAPFAARRRLLVASLGVGEPLPAQSLGEEAVALEVIRFRCRLAVGLLGMLRQASIAITNLHVHEVVDTFLEAPMTQENQRRCSLVRRGRSAAQGRTVRDLALGGGALWSSADGPRHGVGRSATWHRSSGSLPDGRTVRALGPDGPRVRRGGGNRRRRPGSRSREGPRRGGEILGVV
jgi:hypothetical protein